MALGRPVESVPQTVAESALAWIAEGKPLREWCRIDGNPSFGTIYNWIKKDADFAERFARARDVGEDVIAQECLAIADDGSNDWMETKFGPQVNQEHIQRSRLRVDTRLKLLAKWNPKKYGERIEHTGDLSIKTVLVPSPAKELVDRPLALPAFDDENPE